MYLLLLEQSRRFLQLSQITAVQHSLWTPLTDINWPAPNSCGFMSQLVEHCTGFTEAHRLESHWILNVFVSVFVDATVQFAYTTANIIHNVVGGTRSTNPVFVIVEQKIDFGYSALSARYILALIVEYMRVIKIIVPISLCPQKMQPRGQ